VANSFGWALSFSTIRSLQKHASLLRRIRSESLTSMCFVPMGRHLTTWQSIFSAGCRLLSSRASDFTPSRVTSTMPLKDRSYNRTTSESARMNQIIGILDSYAYRTLVWDIHVERTSEQRGMHPDEQRIAAAIPLGRLCIDALSSLMGKGTWLAGSTLSLADLHAAPMFAYLVRTPEGKDLLRGSP
jgi:Glutathione S-transferase, C-terminal domain